MKVHGTTSTQADRMWRSYDVRAILPIAIVLALISMIILIERWISDDLSTLAETIGLSFIYIPLALMWSSLLSVALYRCITYTYRLTDQSLLIDRGFRWRPTSPIELVDICEVKASMGVVGRWLGVGMVKVITKSGRVIELTGVRSPTQFAAEIRSEVHKKQAATL